VANIFFGLNIGRSALVAHQTALDVTGHNLANVQTEGFSRQRVQMSQSLPIQTPQGAVGSGVDASKVERLQLGYLERQIVRVTSQNGHDVALTRGLDEMQSILGEPSADGLNASLSEFWNAWDALSASPTDAALRAQVVDRAEHLATVYNQKIDDLSSLESRFDEALGDALGDVNVWAREVADLNGRIAKSEASGYTANDLRDQRDRLVRQLASTLGVEAEADGSYVNLRLADGGPYLVNRAESFELTAARDDGGHLAGFHIGSAPVTPTGGEMGALLELRDTLSPGLRDQLSQWMSTVVDRVNQLHTAGVDRDGEAGRNLFMWTGDTASVALAPSSGLVAVAAAPGLEPGTHYLSVASVDPSLTANALGTLSSGNLTLTSSGSYTGDPVVNRDYSVRVLSANATPGTLEGLRVQLFRDGEAVGPVVSFDGTAGASASGVSLGSVDGLTFTADLAAPPAGSFVVGERSDGLSTTGSLSLDGGAPVAVDLTTTNNIAFTGGSAQGFLAGGVATVNFGGGPVRAASFTLSGRGSRLALDPLVAADADKVAAARAPVAGGTPSVGDGEIARRIADLATQGIFEDIGETAAGFLGRVVQSLGAKGRDARVFEEASTSVLQQLDAQRESVSGVNVDEEMVQLLQYQRGFEAAARFLTTVDGLIDTLINRVGLVGR
jgi:flagellar hook-associated protein 1 FlgK